MRIESYILPFKERHRLHGRAFRAQQRDHSEICGVLIVGSDKKIELRFLKNASTTPYRYELYSEDISSIERIIKGENKRILGTFHSHPVGESIPGKGDMEKGFYKGVEMIYDVCAREIKLWRLIKTDNAFRVEEIPLIIEPQMRSVKKAIEETLISPRPSE